MGIGPTAFSTRRLRRRAEPLAAWARPLPIRSDTSNAKTRYAAYGDTSSLWRG